MAEQYYHDAITDRSWRSLQQLRTRYHFILIGGWATWAHTQGAKSRDIDIIVDFSDLTAFRGDYEVRKNDRLRRYEVKCDGFGIDIYIPHYSTTLPVPPEYVQMVAETRMGFHVPPVDVLLGLNKIGAWLNRRGTPNGAKDLVDIGALLPLTDADSFSRALLAAALPADRMAALLRGLEDARAALPQGVRLAAGRGPTPEVWRRTGLPLACHRGTNFA
jgi:hypothetical protein